MTRRALVLALLVLPLGATPARALTRADLTGYADRAAAVWAGRQAPNGEFLDPHSGRPSGGYGNAFIGYALLRAGARRHDQRLIRAGVRGVSSSLAEPPASRGVFDLLSMAAAYKFARAALARDPAFAAARPRWEAYLRASGPPNVENKARACILSPSCFHNHEAVGATADLELAATGIDAPALGSPGVLRERSRAFVGTEEPPFATGSARIEGPRPARGLALLSDSGSWPLAYHALCTAMLARAIDLLGRSAPAAARATLRRTTAALAGLMAPDGDVAYIGRRQETIWSLAATIAATVRGQPATAQRAFERLRARYPLTSRGLPIVPRSGTDAFSPKGVDSRPMVFNGLALYLLEVAADRAPARAPHAGTIPADSDGAFVDPSQARFAAVRHGGVWFAVHARRNPPDLRYDAGLVSGKWRSPSGHWVDFVPPRPFLFDGSETAGPVIERGGRRILPTGALHVRGDRVRVGAVRYAPHAAGVAIAVHARPGDRVVYTTYGNLAKSTPAGRVDVVRTHLASCCALEMHERRLIVTAPRDGLVRFYVGVRTNSAVGSGQLAVGNGHSRWWWLIPIGAALALAALAVRRARR